MRNYAFINETDSDLVNESSHLIGYRVKDVAFSDDINNKFQIAIVLDSDECFYIWVLEEPDPLIKDLIGMVVTRTEEGNDDTILVISSNEHSFTINEVYEYAFKDKFYGHVFGEESCDWPDYFIEMLEGFSLTQSTPVRHNSGMSIEMIDKDGVVRDVIIEDYHDEVYCTDVNYRVNKWTNYHNNLNDPSSRIAGIRIFSQSYTSAKDSSDGKYHAIMGFEVIDCHEHVLADFTIELVAEDFWFGSNLNSKIIVK